MSIQLYNDSAYACSQLITARYSTSFTLGIRMLARTYHAPIYAIYGFVRLADEIVDTFHTHDKQALLDEFRAETYRAIERGISLNPVLHAFQDVVNRYHIEHELIAAFLHSMEMDLTAQQHEPRSYDEYIYGSAEVVGLMCLRVFCAGDEAAYQRLREPARRLGAAFQKVNFLRDMQADYVERGRVYFPNLDFSCFDCDKKAAIEADIEADFAAAYEGIRQLPAGAKLGVLTAYIYYRKLLRQISRLTAQRILQERVRVANPMKLALLVRTWLQYKLNYL